PAMSQADDLLRSYLEADRILRAARMAFLAQGETPDGIAALAAGVDRGFADKESEDGGSALMRIADVLVDIANADAAKLLFKILGHEEPEVRVSAGEALMELLYDRFAEVARIIEAEIDRGGNAVALAEVPFILAEVGEPGGVKIVTKLLKHADAEVVGAAIEGLAAMGDPTALKALEPLKNDKRKVTMEEDDENAGEVTIGELAGEAIEHLRGLQRA
ncbi:MAG: HEAT repeat domain-containing protein, partial [Deltaproteobacteria bacterium]